MIQKTPRAQKPFKQFLLALYCGIFLITCWAPLLGRVTGIRETNLEKRTLSALPDLFNDSGPNLAFTRQFDDYYADHFTFRPYLITAWHHVNMAVLRQSGSDRVLLGQQGWLFFQDAIEAFRGDDALDPADWRRLMTILALQENYLADQGIAFLFTVAPDKNSLYGALMPDRLRTTRPRNLEEGLSASRLDAYVDLYAELRLAVAESAAPLYHRADSHWNNLGACVAAAALLERSDDLLAAFTPFLPLDQPSWRQDWLGDLAIMLAPSGPKPDLQAYYPAEPRFRFTRAPRSLEDILIETTNPASSGRMLMFRDSFANALIPFLSDSFAAALYSRALPWDYGLLDDFAADLVILEIVERNLPQLLLRPPRMPAPIIDPSGVSTGTKATASVHPLPENELSLSVSMSGDWLKITALGLSAAWQEIDRVILNLDTPVDSVCFEAFPIADDGNSAWRDNFGFTAYLLPGQWQAGRQNITLFLHTPEGWQHVRLAITLPDM